MFSFLGKLHSLLLRNGTNTKILLNELCFIFNLIIYIYPRQDFMHYNTLRITAEVRAFNSVSNHEAILQYIYKLIFYIMQ